MGRFGGARHTRTPRGGTEVTRPGRVDGAVRARPSGRRPALHPIFSTTEVRFWSPFVLVLGRKRDEEIVIGDGEIVITVVDIRGDRVRLGVKAKKEIPVHRREIFDAIAAEGRHHAVPGVPCG